MINAILRIIPFTLVGILLPLLVIFSNLSELELQYTFENIFYDIKSQFAVKAIIISSPLLFTIIGFLFVRVLQKTKQIKEEQKKNLELAHEAGMAEIAGEIIHNIGNILSALFIYIQKIEKQVALTCEFKFDQVKSLITPYNDDLYEFFQKDQKGKKLSQYIWTHIGETKDRMEVIATNIKKIEDLSKVISNILRAQRMYAQTGVFVDKYKIYDIVLSSIEVLQLKITSYNVVIENHVDSKLEINVERSKLINILVNIIKNALEACENSEQRHISISTQLDSNSVSLIVKDTGVGIEKDMLEKIFNHGVTTKKNGNGFGLHSCANLTKELKGSLVAQSEGIGKGASFVLRIPIDGRGEINEQKEN